MRVWLSRCVRVMERFEGLVLTSRILSGSRIGVTRLASSCHLSAMSPKPVIESLVARNIARSTRIKLNISQEVLFTLETYAGGHEWIMVWTAQRKYSSGRSEVPPTRTIIVPVNPEN